MSNGPSWDRGAKYTVSVDFDGVIHSYKSKWIAADVIPDGPVDGAIDWLNEIRETFRVVIHTTRAKEQAGALAVRKWLVEHGFDATDVEITAVKPAALVYIDDRGFRFDGKNWPTANQIAALVPWNRKPIGFKW